VPENCCSLGPQGAVLITKDSYDYVSAPNVVKAPLVLEIVWWVEWSGHCLRIKKPLKLFAGEWLCAATMNEGTQLFKLEDAKII
jgi:6-phosphofructokinase 2